MTGRAAARAMRATALIAALLLWPQPWAAAQAALAPTRLHFVAYSTGLRVLDVQATLALGQGQDQIDLALQTLGLFSVFVTGHTQTVARGAWRDDAAMPAFFGASGEWRGKTLLTRMTYVGGQPDVSALLPPITQEREPVPPALQANTIDSLSAMAELVRRVNDTGRCEGAARTFDGRRLSEITVRTAGMQMLARTSLSIFAGPALRCDFDGRLLAGFKFEDDRARAARPRRGSAWFARLSPGGPLLPVRLQFATPFFDDATMYLQP